MNKQPRARIRLTGLAVSFALVAACSSGASATPPGQPADGIPTLNPDNPFSGVTISFPVASGTVTGQVGDKLTFIDYGGDPIDVTLVKVFDPAVTTDANAEPLSGAHWVGAEIVIDTHSATGASGEVVDATASDGTTLTTDDHYEGFDHPIGGFQGCTAVNTDEQPETYCVAFVVPDGQTLSKVGVKVGGAEIFDSDLVPDDQAAWAIP